MNGPLHHLPDLTPRAAFPEAADDAYIRMTQALRAADGDPSKLPEPLSIRYQHNLAANLMKEKVFFSVSEKLRTGGIAAVYPIKGMHLLLALYRDLPGIRTMVDIDLIVRRDEFAKLPGIVRANPAWQPDMARLLGLRSRIAADLSFIADHTSVEVKRDLVLMPVVDFQPFFDAAKIVTVAGKEAHLLQPDHAALLYILHHIGDHLLHYRRIEHRHLAEFSVILANLDDRAAFRELCRANGIGLWYDLILFLIYTLFERPVVTPADFTIHPVFACIEKRRDGTLGPTGTARLTALLYGAWTVPLLARNALLWLPKKVVHKKH